MSQTLSLPIKVFDFFSGCGGTCVGFEKAGLDIVYALDSDEDARASFLRYPKFNGVTVEARLIEEVAPKEISPLVQKCSGHPLLFSGCAPCQPFTRQNTQHRADDDRVPLLMEFLKFVKEFVPEFVFVENVPGIQSLNQNEGPLSAFVSSLESMKYSLKSGVVVSQDYGVPQHRRRFVLVASRLGGIDLPAPTHGPRSRRRCRYRYVRDTIESLPPIAAGEQHSSDPFHWAAALRDINLKRIRCCREGEGREKWPAHLRLRCHDGYSGHTDVYGRMSWDKPATGLTTRCISLSNGRFGHPEQARAISIREAALLQTFPRWYEFFGSMQSMARQIGNAVPPRLAEVFGRHFIRHFKEHYSDG